MSVHGEFERYLRDALTALRESEGEVFLTWAEEVEAQLSRGDLSLEERAHIVLASPLGRHADWTISMRLASSVEGLLSISRIILGH